jgi:hypothetical protein
MAFGLILAAGFAALLATPVQWQGDFIFQRAWQGTSLADTLDTNLFTTRAYVAAHVGANPTTFKAHDTADLRKRLFAGRFDLRSWTGTDSFSSDPAQGRMPPDSWARFIGQGNRSAMFSMYDPMTIAGKNFSIDFFPQGLEVVDTLTWNVSPNPFRRAYLGYSYGDIPPYGHLGWGTTFEYDSSRIQLQAGWDTLEGKFGLTMAGGTAGTWTDTVRWFGDTGYTTGTFRAKHGIYCDTIHAIVPLAISATNAGTAASVQTLDTTTINARIAAAIAPAHVFTVGRCAADTLARFWSDGCTWQVVDTFTLDDTIIKTSARIRAKYPLHFLGVDSMVVTSVAIGIDSSTCTGTGNSAAYKFGVVDSAAGLEAVAYWGTTSGGTAVVAVPAGLASATYTNQATPLTRFANATVGVIVGGTGAEHGRIRVRGKIILSGIVCKVRGL